MVTCCISFYTKIKGVLVYKALIWKKRTGNPWFGKCMLNQCDYLISNILLINTTFHFSILKPSVFLVILYLSGLQSLLINTGILGQCRLFLGKKLLNILCGRENIILTTLPWNCIPVSLSGKVCISSEQTREVKRRLNKNLVNTMLISIISIML